MANLRAGADIDCLCGHCGLELAHVIIAMDGANPARVQCKTCRTEHAFRRGKATTPKKSAPRANSRRATPSGPASLDELLRGRDPKTARPYVMTMRYNQNDLLRHARFGLGIVVGLPQGDKAEVLFPTGLKVLAHGRQNS